MSEVAKNAPRILILTSSTGGGHDSRAYSLAQWLEAAGACVRVEHLLENSSWLPRFGVWVYNTIQRTAPTLHNAYWFIAEGFARMQGERLSFGRSYFVRLLRDFRPDLVVSMHDCLNRGYFQCARETLGPSVRTATYCGEWSGGFGFSRNWVEKSADLFVARTSDAWEYALLCGMPAERAETFCNLLPPRAFEKPLTADERRVFRQSLGLDPERFTVLLAAGAAGANNHVRLLDQLAGIPERRPSPSVGKAPPPRGRSPSGKRPIRSIPSSWRVTRNGCRHSFRRATAWRPGAGRTPRRRPSTTASPSSSTSSAE